MEVKPYQPITIECKKNILNIINCSLEYLDKCVQIVREWLKAQKHFPEKPSDKMIEFFLLLTQFDFDVFKEKIDNYYTIRSQIPELYTISNPRLNSMQDTLNFTKILPLPKPINNFEQVIVIKIVSPFMPDDFDAHSWLAAIINIHEVFMQQSIALYSVFLYDLKHLTLAQMLKITPTFIMNGGKILEEVFNDRILYIHVINYPAIFNVVLTLCKSVMRKSLFDRFLLHDNNESLAKQIPLNILPKDYGGDEKSLEELEELWRAKLVEYQDRFDKLETLIVDESLRPIQRHKEREGLIEIFSKLFVYN